MPWCKYTGSVISRAPIDAKRPELSLVHGAHRYSRPIARDFLQVCDQLGQATQAPRADGHQHPRPTGDLRHRGRDDADRIDIPIHAFDVIVADECHRGYTSQETWRSTLDHFDAIKISLTATPASHTTAPFPRTMRFDHTAIPPSIP